jgi:glycosyltransferase involved in cell wall biosynthesis
MSKKINISIIGTRGYPYVYSGYETFVKQLSERLVLKDCNVTIYCHKGLFKIKPKEIKGIKLVYVPTIETKILSQPIHSFLSIIHACFSNTDVLLVVNSANGPFGLLTKLFRIPTAINVDGLEWLRPKWKGLGSIYFKWASKVIAYGAYIRKSKSPDLINKWNLKQREYYLVIGRLIPDNNADLIIKGFLKSNSNKKLVIVGDVPYKDSYASDLKNMVDKRLIFTGYVKDQDLLAELYHNCYVYVHGHEFGGTNPTMIKAMAYGCAILALDTVFNKEMLQKGKFGLFFKKELISVTNQIDYCEKENILMDKLRNESVNGITKKYDWDCVTKDYLEVFNSLVGQRNQVG